MKHVCIKLAGEVDTVKLEMTEGELVNLEDNRVAEIIGKTMLGSVRHLRTDYIVWYSIEEERDAP